MVAWARSADPHAAWRRSVRPTPCGGPPSVRSAILPGGETKRQRSVASGKWPCSRLLPICLGRAEPRGLLRCPRRQAKPRAVLRRLARAKHRGLLLVLAGRSLAAILLVLADMRSIAASCFGLCPGSGDAPGTRRLGSLRYIGAPAGCFDGLDSLRPSKRRSRSQAWSKCFSCGMQGWNDWSGAAGKLTSPSRARGEQCGYLA